MKTQKEIQPCICGSLDHDSHPNEPQHTPTPWKLETNYAWHDGFKDRGSIFSCNMKVGTHVPEDQNIINAAFIVRAVNAHGELVNTLHHLLNQPELLTDDFYRKQIKEMLVKAESNV